MHRSMSASAAAVTHQSKNPPALRLSTRPVQMFSRMYGCMPAAGETPSKITPCPPTHNPGRSYPGGQVPLQIYDQDLARVECTETCSLPPIIDDVSRGPRDGSIPHSAMHSTTKTQLLPPGFYSLELSCSYYGLYGNIS